MIKSKQARERDSLEHAECDIPIDFYEDEANEALNEDDELEYYFVVDYMPSSHTPFKMPVMRAYKRVVE